MGLRMKMKKAIKTQTEIQMEKHSEILKETDSTMER